MQDERPVAEDEDDQESDDVPPLAPHSHAAHQPQRYASPDEDIGYSRSDREIDANEADSHGTHHLKVNSCQVNMLGAHSFCRLRAPG